MYAGQVLYRDFWDLKEPGIYAVHWLAGKAFGFNEVGLHSFELILLLALAGAQTIVLRPSFSHPAFASLVPVATVVAYYAVISDWHLTQPAVLLSAPLFGVLASAGVAGPRPALRWTFAGVCGGLALTFKLGVGPVIIGLLLVEVLLVRWIDGETWPRLLRGRVLPALGGAILVAGGLLLWLDWHDALHAFVWTHREWRTLALAEIGAHPYARVFDSAYWFATTFWPWLLLAACAPLGWRGLAAERIFVLALVWAVLGAVATWVEPFAGWEFDFLILVVPIGLLAIRGVQGLIAVAQSRIPLAATRPFVCAAAIVVLASLPGGRVWIGKARQFADGAVTSGIDVRTYQRAVSSRYAAVWSSTAFLRADSTSSDPIYVFGDPLVQLLAGRPLASTVHGWAWELQPATIWRRVEGELAERRPRFIFVEPTYDTMIASRAAGLRALLDSAYTVRTQEPIGTWYERRADTPAQTAEDSR